MAGPVLGVLIVTVRCPQQWPSGNFERERAQYLQVLGVTWHTWDHTVRSWVETGEPRVIFIRVRVGARVSQACLVSLKHKSGNLKHQKEKKRGLRSGPSVPSLFLLKTTQNSYLSHPNSSLLARLEYVINMAVIIICNTLYSILLSALLGPEWGSLKDSMITLAQIPDNAKCTSNWTEGGAILI